MVGYTRIHRWIQEGEPKREIARRVSRNPGRLSREIGRNPWRSGYRPQHAHDKATAQATRAGPRRFTDAVRLKEGGTPAIIGGRARRGGHPFPRHAYASTALSPSG